MLLLPSLFLHGHFVVGNSNDILMDDEEDNDDVVNNDFDVGVGNDNNPHRLRVFSFSTAAMALLAELLS